MNRRALLRVVAGAALMLAARGAAAQSDEAVAEDAAESFVRDLIAAGARRDPAEVEALLRERADLPWAFSQAFAPVEGVVSSAQRDRLTELMVRFMAYEVMMLADLAQEGRFRMAGARREDDGIRVEGVFQDGAGDYFFSVLMGEPGPGTPPGVRDIASPRASSVAAKLRYATTSLAQVTTDADVWIRAFEKAVGG